MKYHVQKGAEKSKSVDDYCNDVIIYFNQMTINVHIVHDRCNTS